MKNLSWDVEVPIFKNKIILKQLGFAIGIPFGLLLFIMLIMGAYYGAIMVVSLLILTAIIVMIVFKGTYDLHIEISDSGIKYKNQSKQAEKVRKMSFLAVILGFFAKTPTAAGAGLLSAGRIEMFVRWTDIRNVKYIDRQRTIMVKGGFSQNMALFCLEDNYESIKKIIDDNTK